MEIKYQPKNGWETINSEEKAEYICVCENMQIFK